MATLTAEMVGATLLVTLAGDLVADPLTEDRAALAVLLAELDELGGIVVDLRGVTSLGRAGASVVLCCYQQAPRFCPVRQYEHVSALRSIAWQRSPEGMRVAAERADRAAEAQRIVDWHLETLPALPWDDTAAVVAWVDGIADAADHVVVTMDREAVRATFAEHGWPRGANCGDAFNANDARNFAGWLVGQWLACWYPVSMFAAQWRERFPHECAN